MKIFSSLKLGNAESSDSESSITYILSRLIFIYEIILGNEFWSILKV